MANPQQEYSQADAPSVAQQASTARLDPRTARELTKVYWNRRVEYQLGYYQKRAREYESNVDSAFRLGAILMTISSLLASLGVVVSSDPTWAPLISLLTAIIPAIVSYIAAFRQLYQWDRQLALYQETQLSLEGAKLAIPDLKSISHTNSLEYFPTLVKEVETVLEQEIRQWGKIAQDQSSGDAEQDLDDTLRAFLTDADGNVDELQLDTLKSIVAGAKETPRAGQYRQSADGLETESALLDDNFYEQARQRRERIRAQQQEVENLANAASQRTPTTSPERPELVGAQPPEYDVDEIGTGGDETEDEPDEPAPATDTIDTTAENTSTVISEPADISPDVPASTVDVNAETVETGMNVVIGEDTVNDAPVTDDVAENREPVVEETAEMVDADVPTMERPIVMPDVPADAPDLTDIDALQSRSAETVDTVVEETAPDVADVPETQVEDRASDPIADDDFEAQFPASDVTDGAGDVDAFDDDLSDDAFVVDDYDIVDWSSETSADEPAGTTTPTDDDDEDTYSDIEEINDY